MSTSEESEEYAPTKAERGRKLAEAAEKSRAAAKSRPRRSQRSAALKRIPINDNSSSDEEDAQVFEKKKSFKGKIQVQSSCFTFYLARGETGIKEYTQLESQDSRRSFPKPELPPADVFAPSSESGPDAPISSNARVSLRQQVKKETQSQDNQTKSVSKKKEDFTP